MEVVKKMSETLGFKEKNIIESLEANSHNIHTTTYKLILKKRLISGNGTPYDINYEYFNPEFLVKKKFEEKPKQKIKKMEHIDDSSNNEGGYLEINIEPKANKKSKVIISTGGTSSLDGKMGKMGFKNIKASNNLKKSNRQSSRLQESEFSNSVYRSRTRENSKNYRKKIPIGKARNEEYLPNLEFKEKNHNNSSISRNGEKPRESSKSRKRTIEGK